MRGVFVAGKCTRRDMEKSERVVRGRRENLTYGARGSAEQNLTVSVGFRDSRGIPLDRNILNYGRGL